MESKNGDQKTLDELLLLSSPTISILRSVEVTNEDDNYDEDDDDDNNENESDQSESSLTDENNSDANVDDAKSNKSLDELACFSPPKSARALKSITKKAKKTRKSKESNRKRNNQKLINSAHYVDTLSTEEMSKLTDSLSSMQEEHTKFVNANNNSNASSISAPPSSAIHSNPMQPFDTAYNYWEHNKNNMYSTSDKSLNNLCENRIMTYSERCNFKILSIKVKFA